MSTISRFVLALKARLENEAAYVDELEGGDTETGFYVYDRFDFDKLCAEIDAFAAEFKKA